MLRKRQSKVKEISAHIYECNDNNTDLITHIQLPHNEIHQHKAWEASSRTI